MLKLVASDISILFVEDNKTVRQVFLDYLSKFFKKIDICVDGLEGLEQYKKEKYDIVITDIDMPNMDGLEMSKLIKEIDSNQHIIIVSAYKKIENYIEAIKIGVDGYILKPVEYDQVNHILLKTVTQINNQKFNEIYKSNLKNMLDQKSEDIKKQFITDGLTGLKNRVYLDRELNKEGKKSLILLNVNNFNMINNNFGFPFSDRVLKIIAHKLEKYESVGFELFKLQSDVFVFLSFTKGLNEARMLAQKIKEIFENESIIVRGIKLYISFSIAIDCHEDRDLLKSTNLKIQELRQNHKNEIGIFEENSEFEKQQLENLNMIEKIRKISLEDDLILHFQPIKNLKSNKIEKYEVLSRIKTPENEMIMPNNFLKPIILAGLSSTFTKAVIIKAFKYFQDKDLSFSINISEMDLKENFLDKFLLQKSKEYGIEPNRVILEILETVSMSRDEQIVKHLKAIKDLGFMLAIDDFGSESSNFSRLLELDVDFIKIDGSFIKGIVENKNSREIVKAIVAFSHNIGYEVIAEFVHNEKVYETLRELNVDFAQGFYVGKALDGVV